MKLFTIYQLTFIFLSLFFLSACDTEETVEQGLQTQNYIKQEAMPRLFMRTQTRRLRVRKTPDLEGTVLRILSEGLIVEYLYDSTNFTTEITYNRKDYNTHWYKIQTADKTEGWVYAAFVKFLPDQENQKVVIQRETAELLEAANEKQPQLTPKQQKEQKQPTNNSLVASYKTYLNALDKNNPSSVSLAISKYNSMFVHHYSNEKTHDAAYVAFHNFYQRMLQVLQRSNSTSYDHLKEEIQRYQRATMQTDPYTRSLGENGFNFAIKDGSVVLAEDVDFLYRIFYRECSTPMRAYMNQYELEEPNFWLDNESLLISPKKLARWALSWNYFVATYPDFIWHSDAKKRLEQQLNILLRGTNQQPAFNDQSFILNAAYLKAYRHIVDNYPESKIGQSFAEYIQVLKDNNWKASSEVTQIQNKIMRTLVL